MTFSIHQPESEKIVLSTGRKLSTGNETEKQGFLDPNLIYKFHKAREMPPERLLYKM